MIIIVTYMKWNNHPFSGGLTILYSSDNGGCMTQCCADEFPEWFNPDTVEEFSDKLELGTLNNSELNEWYNGLREYVESIHTESIFKFKVVSKAEAKSITTLCEAITILGECAVGGTYWALTKYGNYYGVEVWD